MANWRATTVLLIFVIATAVLQQNDAYSDFNNEVSFFI